MARLISPYLPVAQACMVKFKSPVAKIGELDTVWMPSSLAKVLSYTLPRVFFKGLQPGACPYTRLLGHMREEDNISSKACLYAESRQSIRTTVSSVFSSTKNQRKRNLAHQKAASERYCDF